MTLVHFRKISTCTRLLTHHRYKPSNFYFFKIVNNFFSQILILKDKCINIWTFNRNTIISFHLFRPFSIKDGNKFRIVNSHDII